MYGIYCVGLPEVLLTGASCQDISYTMTRTHARRSPSNNAHINEWVINPATPPVALADFPKRATLRTLHIHPFRGASKDPDETLEELLNLQDASDSMRLHSVDSISINGVVRAVVSLHSKQMRCRSIASSSDSLI